jgi:ribonuclease HI
MSNIQNTHHLKIFTDGGSRGNPGEAAIGIAMYKNDGNLLVAIGKRIGVNTNNFAEYTALQAAYEYIYEQQKDKTCETKIEFFLDSELVVKQLTGLYKVKDVPLSQIYQTIKQHEKRFKEVTYQHVKRELNKTADKLVNDALDNKI